MVLGGVHHRHPDSIVVVRTQRAARDRNARGVILVGREAITVEAITVVHEAGAMEDVAEARFVAEGVKVAVSGAGLHVSPLTGMPLKRSAHGFSSTVH